jgi:hypothetical protein
MPQSSAEPTPAVPERAPQASPAKATAHPQALPPQAPLALRLSLGSEVPVGITPAPTAGAKLGLGLEGRRWLVLLEVNAALASTHHSVYGDVSAWPAGTALLPCARPALGPNVALDVCAAARFGALFSHAEGVSRSVRTRVPLLAFGPRLGLEWLPWQSLGFALDLEATLPVTRVHLLIEDLGRRQEVWASARIGMIGGLSLLVRLN